MASRLSEESLVEVLETGHQGLAVEGVRAVELLSEPEVDLDKLLDTEEPDAAVQAIEPYRIYRAILKRGPEDSLEVLPHLSNEQVTRIMDYEAWHEDRLEPHQAIRWLKLFREVSHEELIKRYRDLDEEFQIALLAPYVEIVDEDEYEKLDQEQQDQLHAMPGNALYYKLKSQDPRLVEFITDLIDSGMMVDIEYTHALLAHAALLPPNEQEALLRQFRRARIEEDGFVSFEESMTAFHRVDLAALRAKWPLLGVRGEAEAVTAKTASDDGALLENAMRIAARQVSAEEFDYLGRSFAYLANSLTAAGKIGTDDQNGLRRLLSYAQGFVSLALDWLADGDPTRAAEILVKEHAKTLFRAGLSLVGKIQDETAARLERFGVPAAGEIVRCQRLDKRGLLLFQLDTKVTEVVGFERTETLKGLFNRYPVRPKEVQPANDGVQRVIFTRLTSVHDLAELAGAVDATLGLLHLAASAGRGEPLVDLDRRLTTGIARVLIGGGFDAAPLSEGELKMLLTLASDAAQQRIHSFLTGLEETLQQGLEAQPSWAASVPVARVLGDVRLQPDSLQTVVSAFSDLVLRLSAVREQAKGDANGARALAALVDTTKLEDKHGD